VTTSSSKGVLDWISNVIVDDLVGIVSRKRTRLVDESVHVTH
jgi:hypothetical protein